MNADDLEVERAALLAALDRGDDMTPDLERRIEAVAAADREAGRRLAPFAQALGEVLAEAFAVIDRPVPPGFELRPAAGRMVDVLSRGVVVATISLDHVDARAKEISVARGT